MKVFVFALSTLALAAAAAEAGAANGRGTERCAAAVESVLRSAGIGAGDLASSRWRIDATRSSDETNVWGYWFLARPKSCPAGDIVIYLSSTCGVRDVSTQGGCSVPGLR